MKKPFLIKLCCAMLVFTSGCDVRFHKGVVASVPESTMAASTDDGMWIIEWHTNATGLSYAVISGPSPSEAHGHVRAGGSSTGETWAFLHKPDGTEVSILDSGRVFHVLGTNVTEALRPIPAATFVAFLDSKPKDYSLSALLKFVGDQK